jgi:hypothetical protein
MPPAPRLLPVRRCPGCQRGLKLFVDHLAAVDGAFGQDPDRRDVGQGKVCGEE